MIPVYTAAEARAADAAILEGLGLPGIALMEAASAGIVSSILRYHAHQASRGVVILCGPGNNGGDGFGIARRLLAAGIDVAVWPLAESHDGDAGIMRAVAVRAGVPEVSSLSGAGLVVDAVFGTGLSRPIEGRIAEVIETVSASGLPVVAVDLPSGLDGDTGQVLGTGLRAVRTITWGGFKRGLFAGDGPALAGAIDVVDLGFTDPDPVGSVLVEAGDVAAVWPRRAASDHKTRSGRLLILAGSRAMAGAAVLAARGALAGGAGLVTVAVPPGAVSRLGALPPEVMMAECGQGDVWDGTWPDLDPYDALVVGPGLGGGAPLAYGVRQSLAGVLSRDPRPVVVDADALPALAGEARGARVLTPHPGEAAGRLGIDIGSVEGDRFAAVRALAGGSFTALLKGPHTLVAFGDEPIRINPTGSSVLATGGSGDVLAGLLGALCARGVGGPDAAMAAAWAHGAAGEALASQRAEGWTAGDVADVLPDAVADRLRRSWSGLPRPDAPGT